MGIVQHDKDDAHQRHHQGHCHIRLCSHLASERVFKQRQKLQMRKTLTNPRITQSGGSATLSVAVNR